MFILIKAILFQYELFFLLNKKSKTSFVCLLWLFFFTFLKLKCEILLQRKNQKKQTKLTASLPYHKCERQEIYGK